MRLKHIETLLDSVDPYFLVKDLGLRLIDQTYITELKHSDKRVLCKQEKTILEEFDFLLNQNSNMNFIKLLNNTIRILPYSYLNVSLLKNQYIPIPNNDDSFVAGSVMDLLAFYCSKDDFENQYDISAYQFLRADHRSAPLLYLLVFICTYATP